MCLSVLFNNIQNVQEFIILDVSLELIANKSRVGEQSQDVGRENRNTIEDRRKEIETSTEKLLHALA